MPLRGLSWISRQSAMKLDHFYYEDDFIGDTETISNTLTLTKSGVCLVIQPSTDPTSGNVFEIKNAAGGLGVYVTKDRDLHCLRTPYMDSGIWVGYNYDGQNIALGRAAKYAGSVQIYGGSTYGGNNYATLTLTTPYWKTGGASDWAKNFITINAPNSHTGAALIINKCGDDIGGTPVEKFSIDPADGVPQIVGTKLTKLTNFFLTGTVVLNTYYIGSATDGIPMPHKCNINEGHITALTAPTGTTLIITIHNITDGTNDTITLGIGATYATDATIDLAFDAGDKLAIQVTQIGSTIAGADLNITLEYSLA